MRRRVAIVGSHGLYASYGGFDQLVNNLVERRSPEVEYLVFNPVETPVADSLPPGVRVIRILLSASGMVGIVYDFLSILLCIGRVDSIVLLGIQGMPLLSLLRPFFRPRVVGNIGGIEWERPHLGTLARWYLKLSFDLAVKHADVVILDNEHYRQFLPIETNASVRIIPYGGTIDDSLNATPEMLERYSFLDEEYFLSVSRSIEDNGLRELCETFRNLPRHLVLISNFSNSAYGREVLAEFEDLPNVTLIDGLYVKPELDLVRRKCVAYIHTHTKCGTAPSLVEMIRCARPILSIDVPQNRFTLSDEGAFFADYGELDALVRSFTSGSSTHLVPSKHVQDRYAWANVVRRYEEAAIS